MAMLRLLPLLIVAFAVPAPAHAAPPAAQLTPDSEARWVAFDVTPGNQIRFGMTVNGRAATAILDTGVSFTVASEAFAKTIGLHPTVEGQAQAIGGEVSLAWAEIDSLAFGGLARSGGRIAVAELKAIATGSTEPVEVLVGADLLAGHALDIDYDRHRFRLLPSGRLPFTGATVPLGVSDDSGVFVSEVTLGGQRLRPVIVDTGDGSSVTLSHAAWARAGQSDRRLTSAFAFGLGGAIETDLTVLPALRMGGLTARNVEVNIERGAGFSAQTGTLGRIGSGFLQRYRVLLDPRARRMVLRAGARAGAMPVKSTSGLLVGLDRDRLRVLHVMRHSPAAMTGWQAGEQICRVDGIAISHDYLGSPQAGWLAGAPGRTVRIALCGGATRTLTLASFY